MEVSVLKNILWFWTISTACYLRYSFSQKSHLSKAPNGSLTYCTKRLYCSIIAYEHAKKSTLQQVSRKANNSIRTSRTQHHYCRSFRSFGLSYFLLCMVMFASTTLWKLYLSNCQRFYQSSPSFLQTFFRKTQKILSCIFFHCGNISSSVFL